MPPPLPENASRNQRSLYNYLINLETVMERADYSDLSVWAADQTYYARVLKAYREDKAIWPPGALPSKNQKFMLTDS